MYWASILAPFAHPPRPLVEAGLKPALHGRPPGRKVDGDAVALMRSALRPARSAKPLGIPFLATEPTRPDPRGRGRGMRVPSLGVRAAVPSVKAR